MSTSSQALRLEASGDATGQFELAAGQVATFFLDVVPHAAAGSGTAAVRADAADVEALLSGTLAF